MITLYDALSKHDKVLLLDDSCLITKEAPNIFDLISKNALAAYPESERAEFLSHRHDRDFILKKRGIKIRQYFNTGVLLAHASTRELFSPRNIYRNIDLFQSSYPDQAYFNYIVNSRNIKVTALTENWNYIPISHYADNKNRKLSALPEGILEVLLKQNFIHITGYYKYRGRIIEQISDRLNS
jgi:lipopolysaccharide biosynthesis glycosyltransferase